MPDVADPVLAIEESGGVTRLSGFGRPFGFAMDAAGRLLVCDMDRHAICRISADLRAYEWLGHRDGWSGERLLRSGRARQAPQDLPERFNGPHAVAVAPDGRLFVTTYYKPGLHALDPATGEGGRIDTRPGGPTLKGPATATLDDGRTLLVTEYALHGIFAYDLDGAFLGALGGGTPGFADSTGFPAGSGPGQFDRPHMCRRVPASTDDPAIGAFQGLVVADTWNHRLQRFTPEGVFAGVLEGSADGWRDDATAGAARTGTAGAFHGVVAVGFAADGRMVACDWGNDRLQWFDAAGRFLYTEESLGLDRPYDAQVYADRCFVADSHHGEVVVFSI